MIVNTRIELTDEQRRLFASYLAGKGVRRMATRAEVREFIEGSVQAAINDSGVERETIDNIPPVRRSSRIVSNLTDEERAEVESLRRKGKTDGYIIGWLTVARGSGAPRPRLGGAS